MLDDAHPTSVSSGASTLEVGPLVQLHIDVARMPWRIGPAWSVLAGALAAGASLATADAWLRLIAAVILADLAWGVLRKLVSTDPQVVIRQAPSLSSAPYARPTAPLTRFLLALAVSQQGSADGVRAALQSLLAGLVFAGALSLLLGIPAMILSALAGFVLWLAWALLRHGNRPAFCLALLDVGLPWLVGASLTWRNLDAVLLSRMLPTLVLAIMFTVLQWGLQRARLSEGAPTGGVWLGQVLVLVTLVGLRQTWALGLVAVLFAPPAWRLLRCTQADRALAFSLPWWWAAMLLTAVAVRSVAAIPL